MRRLFLLLTLVGALLVACTGVVLAQQTSPEQPTPSQQQSSAQLAPPGGSVALCPEPDSPDQSRCLSELHTPDANSGFSSAAASAPVGYQPADLQSAYNLIASSQANGAGVTVALVDAFDNPNAERDLQTYRNQFGLPKCSTANGCFKKVDQRGGTNYPRYDQGWAVEIALDMDMVSAICPNCNILLVETDDNSNVNLDAGVSTAYRLGANAISNSWASTEYFTDPSREPNFDLPGVAITASSGDGGYGVVYPAASRYVTAVGGTSLCAGSLAAACKNAPTWGQPHNGWYEKVWRGAGSGCSAYIPKPPWQTDTGCSNRTVADVSAVADPQTGVAVYHSNSGGWIQIGGTSAGAPIIASVYALAGNTSSINDSSFPYGHTSLLFDVTSGSNGNCVASSTNKKAANTVHKKKHKHKHKHKHKKQRRLHPMILSLTFAEAAYLCTGGPGYDGPSGNGTPNGTGAF